MQWKNNSYLINKGLRALNNLLPVPHQWLLHQWQPSSQGLFSGTEHQWTTQYYLHQSNSKESHKGKFTISFVHHMNSKQMQEYYTLSYAAVSHWKKVAPRFQIRTVIPGKGATSEPVAMSMFFVLITCVLPSSLVAVTWFLPVIFPNPDTCTTFNNQEHSKLRFKLLM